MKDEQNQPGAVGTMPETVDPERAQELLASINRVQLEFISDAPPQQVFATLLENLLTLTESGYGFIGQVLRLEDGTPFLKTHAISDIAWNEETRRLYQENAPNLEFYNLDTLFGQVMVTGKPVIANDPANDVRASGNPVGHPPLRSFLGIPFHSAGQMVGMVGIANRPGGYDKDLIRFLEPFLSTCAHIIVASETAARRRLAESAMHRQALVFENLYDGVVLTDWKGRITDWNPGAERMYGYRREEVLGELPDLFYKPAHGVVPTQDILDCVEREGRWTGESLFVHKDGRTGFSESVVVALRDEQSRPVGTVGVNRDITERKRSEEALRSSEERFRLVTQATRDAIYDWDVRTNDVWRNEPYIRQFGPDSTHAVGGESGWWIECIHPDDRDGVLTGVQNALESNGDRWTADYRLRTTDGSYADVIDMSFIIRDHRGVPIRMIGAMMDITDRKKAEDEIRNSRQTLESTLDSLSAHIALLDDTGTIVSVNAAWRRFARASGLRLPDDGIGANYLEACCENDRVKSEIEKLIRGPASENDGAAREGFEYEYSSRMPSGQEWLVMRATRFEGVGRARVVVSHENITERKKSEDALRAARDELEQRVLERTDHLRAANESLQQVIHERTEMEQRAKQHQAELAHVARISTMGEMAAGLAHELNQPLASISNYADSCVIDVQRDQINPADLLDCLNRISEQALRAGQIIRRLRSFVRKAPPRRSSIDLNQLVGEIVEFLDADARRLDIRVHVDLAKGIPRIQADPIQIEQVVLNLLRNGMESIKSTDHCDRELRIQTSLFDDTVEFSVHDNGRGVPADIAETIFNPFVTTKADGLGLGLSISRSIIEAHSGRLWTDLDEARGATFRFRIPLVSEGEDAHG